MKYALLGALALAACAQPDPIYKPVTVDTPVEVTCRITPVVKPADPLNTVSPQDDINKKVAMILASLEMHLGYETRLEAALKSCQ